MEKYAVWLFLLVLLHPLGSQGVRLLEMSPSPSTEGNVSPMAVELPPIPAEQNSGDSSSPSSGSPRSPIPDPVPIHIPAEKRAAFDQASGDKVEAVAAPIGEEGAAAWTSEKEVAQKPAVAAVANASPARSQTPAATPIATQPPPSDSQQPAQQGLTAVLSRDPEARAGTFTPVDRAASLTCSLPELLAVQPNLEVSKGETVLAAALKGPLNGNFCPGGSSRPFAGCPPGFYCPNPGQRFQCPSKFYCPRGSTQPRACPALAVCKAGSSFPAFHVGALVIVALLALLYVAGKSGFSWVTRSRRQKTEAFQAMETQMWHLLDGQMRATEGFVFQGISNIEDKVDFVLNDLCIRVPGSQIPDLQGLSGRIQASRITLLLAPHGCSLSPLVNLMSAARKSQTTIIGGSVGVTVGESEASLSACRSLIGRISQKQHIVDDAIRLLHLHGIKNAFPSRAIVSGELTWRLSMAMQLVACPSVLIVDEVHLGSHKHDAALCMDSLNVLAGLGMTIITTMLPGYALEQRSANVDLLLLSRDGATVYNGPLRLTVPYFLSIGVANLGCSEEALRDIVSNSDISTPLLDGQTLAEAWKERLQDPWTHKILTSSKSEQELEPEQRHVQLHCTYAARYCQETQSLLPVAAAVLQSLQHKQGLHPTQEVSASTLLAVADVLDLFNAFGVPCSAGTAQRLLVEAVNHAQQVACVEGSSPNGQPHSPPSPGAAATAATAQGGPGQHCTAALVQLVAWLVSQAAERRQTARTCAGLMQPEEDMLAQAWSAKLPMLRLRPGDKLDDNYVNGGGLDLELMPKQAFQSIDIEDGLAKQESMDTTSADTPHRFDTVSSLTRLFTRDASKGDLESHGSKRTSLQLSRAGSSAKPAPSMELPPPDEERPVSLRERNWSTAGAATSGSPANPDAAASAAATQNARPRRGRRQCSIRAMLSCCFTGRVRNGRGGQSKRLVRSTHWQKRTPGFLLQLGLCNHRAFTQWMRHLDSLLHSLILCAAVACVVAQLCASSLGVDSTPAVLLRCVLALALCCAPWSLQPFARAQRHLAHQNLGGTYHLAFYVGTAFVELINVMIRPLIFGGIIAWMLPVRGSFDWYAIAMFLVSWYAAAAGNAAAAHFSPRTALAVVLCALLAAGLLLSGAVAPTLRALHRTASPLYSLTGLSYTRWGVELATAVEYAGFDNAWQHLAMFKLAQIGYCGLEPVPLIGRVESREDVATAVAAALNSAALRAAQGTPLNNILAGAGPALGPQLVAGLQCTLQKATAAGGASGVNCIAKMCRSAVTNDVRALFLLGLSLHLLALLGLCGAWGALARAAQSAVSSVWTGLSHFCTSARRQIKPVS